ncbi:MAG: hypothetical protein QOC82_966 [Frankiaceae bacterium]|jgi:hypothetical protein|nr:hypothetical protein [Frankiaceae bacterium]MDQ1699087.1 hypothetical protein [Frankiaceae bacterium]
MKKFLLPIGAGVVVFGGVTAFAATLNVNSTSLASGNATVSSCNSAAAVTYATTPTTNAKTYDVTTASVTTSGTGSGCASMAYKVTLLGANNASLGEKTGTLDASGAGSVDFTALTVPASDVVGVAVVITG